MTEDNRVLIHACCAICSGYPLEHLKEAGYEPIVYFYNPNIQPDAEYQKRLDAQLTLCNHSGCELIIETYKTEEFNKVAEGLENEPEGGKRCEKCFELRLSRTAQKAKELGFKAFTTSIVISPHKNFKLISKFGNEIAQEYDIKYLDIDFKKEKRVLKDKQNIFGIGLIQTKLLRVPTFIEKNDINSYKTRKKQMKVVILGSGEMFMNLIAGCKDAGCNVVGVFRYDKIRYPLIDRLLIDLLNPSMEYNYIKSHKLYEIKANSANSADFKKEILKLNADIILVGTWGEKLKKPIINLPTIGTINVHPSLLPKYRGPNPYLQVIKNMETQTGVTFHLMDENYDTGAILHQKTLKIEKNDTGKELRHKIALLAREGVCELMQNLDTQIVIPTQQSERQASYYPQITKGEVMLDFTKRAEEVASHIKAFHPWCKCYFEYKNQFFIPNPYKLEIVENITDRKEPCTITEKSGKKNSLTVLCGDGKALKMSEVRLYGYIKRFFTSFYIKRFVKKHTKID